MSILYISLQNDSSNFRSRFDEAYPCSKFEILCYQIPVESSLLVEQIVSGSVCWIFLKEEDAEAMDLMHYECSRSCVHGFIFTNCEVFLWAYNIYKMRGRIQLAKKEAEGRAQSLESKPTKTDSVATPPEQEYASAEIMNEGNSVATGNECNAEAKCVATSENASQRRSLGGDKETLKAPKYQIHQKLKSMEGVSDKGRKGNRTPKEKTPVKNVEMKLRVTPEEKTQVKSRLGGLEFTEAIRHVIFEGGTFEDFIRTASRTKAAQGSQSTTSRKPSS